MDSNKAKKPGVFMWIYSALAWFVSPTYATDLWEKWSEDKKAQNPPPKDTNEANND